MNPLKLALTTVACVCALALAPYAIKHWLPSGESAPTVAKPAETNAQFASLPVETAPSPLNPEKPAAADKAKVSGTQSAAASAAELPKPIELPPAPGDNAKSANDAPVKAQNFANLPAPSMAVPDDAVASAPNVPSISTESAIAPTATQSPASAPPVVTSTQAKPPATASAPATQSADALPKPPDTNAAAEVATGLSAPQVGKPELPYRPEVAKAQELLARLGFQVGNVDGKLGQRTEMAITQFQQKNSLHANGDPDSRTLAKMEKLVADLPAATAAQQLASKQVANAVTPAQARGDNAAAKIGAIALPAKTGDTKAGISEDASQFRLITVNKPNSDSKAAPATSPDPLTAPSAITLPPGVSASRLFSDADDKVRIEPGRVPTMQRVSDVKRIQEKLIAGGTYEGEPDGKWGDKTITALYAFQRKHNMRETIRLDDKMWHGIIAAAKEDFAKTEAAAKQKPNGKSAAPVAAVASIAAPKAPKPADKQKETASRSTGSAKPAVSGLPMEAIAASAAPLPDEKRLIAIATDPTTAKNPIAADEDKAKTSLGSPQPESLEISKPEAPKPVEVRQDAPKTAELPKPDIKVENVAPAKKSDPPLPNAKKDSEPSQIAMVSKPKPPAAAAESTYATAPTAEPASVQKDSKKAGGEVVLRLNSDAGLPQTPALSTPATVTAAEVAPVPTGIAAELPTLAPPKPSGNAPDPFAVSGAKKTAKLPGMIASTGQPQKLITKSPAAATAEQKVASAEPAKSTGTDAAKSPGISLSDSSSAQNVANVIMPPAVTGAKDTALQKEVADAKGQIAKLSSDAHYEAGKYAPQVLDGVNTMVGKVEREMDSHSANTDAIRNELSKAIHGLDDVKRQALNRKATEKVGEIDQIYKVVKARFAPELKKKEFADTMAKIDNGYTAMKTDFKKGNLDPIVDRCDGFRLAIELLANDAAKQRLDAQLGKRSVKSKLPKGVSKQIETLRAQNKCVEALDLLEKNTPKGRSESKDRE